MTTAIAKTLQPSAVRSKTLAAVLALMAGLGVVYLTGFSNAAALHNAAHDGRHSLSFPCH